MKTHGLRARVNIPRFKRSVTSCVSLQPVADRQSRMA